MPNPCPEFRPFRIKVGKNRRSSTENQFTQPDWDIMEKFPLKALKNLAHSPFKPKHSTSSSLKSGKGYIFGKSIK